MICLFSLSCIYYPEYKWLVNAYSVNKLLSVTLACYYSLLIRLMSLKKVRYKYWEVVLPPIPHPPPPRKTPTSSWPSPSLSPSPPTFSFHPPIPYLIPSYLFRYLFCLSLPFPSSPPPPPSHPTSIHSTYVSLCHVMMSCLLSSSLQI